MPLRDVLSALVGRWRQAAPEVQEPEAQEPEAQQEPEPVAPPAPPPPRPRIVLLGAEPRALGLMEIYGLAGREDVVLSDRRPGGDAGEARGHRVWGGSVKNLGQPACPWRTDRPG